MTSVAIIPADAQRPEFEITSYLNALSNPLAIQHQKQLSAAYDAACAALIGPNDVQVEGARTFKKKSAWRKLARHFGISTAVVRVDREYLNTDFLATVTVRALGPWGQSAEAVGACCTDEATGRRVITVADAIATAETRATNRAISNLIAMGEVSAEEIGQRQPGTAPRANGGRSPGEKVMPFGRAKGQPLRTVETPALESTPKWCREKDGEKFKDLIAAIVAVLADRALGTAANAPDDAANDLQHIDEDDDLPF